MSPSRAIMICERFPPDVGGLARSGQRLSRTLARLGVEVHVLAWTRTLPPGVLESLPSVPACSQDVGDVEPHTAGSLLDATPAAAEGGSTTIHRLGLFANWDLSLQHTMNVLDWLHRRVRADFVWGHYLFPAGFAAALFAQLAGLPSTVSARGNDVDRLMFPPGDFARLLWTLERTQLVTAVSEDLARKLRVLVGKPIAIEVLPNAVDAATFAPGRSDIDLRQRLGIRDDEFVLGFCGELRYKKGQHFLFEALREVRMEVPACLLVIGEVRPSQEARLLAFANDCPDTAARVIVTGAIDAPESVATHLRLCDLFLQPSMWDGMPNALLEAMACGLPCIASDAGGIPELIEHERSGVLLPKAHLHCLGKAILELLRAPRDVRNAFGRAARERVMQHFQLGSETAAMRRVLRRMIPSDS